MDRNLVDTAELADRVRAGDRRALGRAITLVESARDDHRRSADDLLSRLVAHAGDAARIGVSGAPGVGKSTFIEAFGSTIIASGERVAVLAVDPSSTRTGGSILGDKTRMEELARSPDAFIRPSPSGGTLGGVARRTREAILVCEAAGFGVVIVETVGVGQSETAVADMVDTFMLLIAPGGGDELQGIKRGIVELADIVVVNKADGSLESVASAIAADYASALNLLRAAAPNWRPRVVVCSALEKRGVADVWETVLKHREALRVSGRLRARRAEQAQGWMWQEVSDSLLATLRQMPGVAGRLSALEADVAAGRTTPGAAGREILDIFRKGHLNRQD
jgi:LAO/AO transport system kinase